jgi:Pro-kumamolisin, activation domain/IPT/TIG domain/PASTA domain/Divergent InlB B-repeat domain
MKRVVRLRALLAVPLLAVVCFTLSAAGAGAASGPAGTKTVAPKPLIPRGATKLGAVSPTKTVSGAVVLQPRDEAALKRFISQVTDKHSPLFHQYLTPTAFAARFGATSSAISAVEAQLSSAGLSVGSVAPDGLVVDFSAPASTVESEFQTGLERYKLAGGSTQHARTAPLKVPATIGKYVTSVVGLDTTVKLRPAGLPRATEAAKGSYPAARSPHFTHPAGSPTACSDATSAAQEFGGLTDDQIANSYGAFGLYGAGDTGAGQHIAIYELEPFATSDLQTFDTCYFGATQAASMLSRVHTINVDGGPGAGPGSGESALDIQDVSAFAPGANIDVYQAPNTTFGALDEYAKIVNDDVDQIITTSWGFCEQGLQEGSPGVEQAENVIFEQAAAQGQTVFSAAGDEGSDDCNTFETTSPVTPVLSVDDPASQPYVVAAGGTTIDDATQPALERVWNDGPVGGAGGGGISEAWPMPAWQDNSRVPGVHNTSAVTAANHFEAADLGQPGYAFCASDNPSGSVEDGCRELPDVSADADEFTGGITIFGASFGGWLTIGGTSSAAPLWAGMLADVNASSTCKNNPATADGVGFVNPLLYSVASNPTAYAASFNDITAGNNDAFGDSQLFQAATGYDMASGLGTPELTQPGGQAGLAFYLCSQAPAATRPTVTSLSPTVGFTDTTTSVTVTGTHFQDSSNPVVGVQVGSYQVPPADFSVSGPTSLTATFPVAADATPSNEPPTGGAGPVEVTVTLQDGESSAVDMNSRFIYVADNGSAQALPSVTGVDGFAGPEAGGNTVDIYGSGFTGATGPAGVTFGGVDATAYTVKSDWLIQATVPAFGSGTSCAAGNDPVNDICQTEVEVTTPNGTSADAPIKPLYEGAISFDDLGVVKITPGDEPAPAATEYDYVPTPTITSISTTGGPDTLASEEGDSVVTIHGRGLNLAALDWVNFGDPTQASSQQFFTIVSDTGTEIQVLAPSFATLTVSPANVPVTVMTAAGLSNSENATYAGIPTVSSVVATSGPTAGQPAGPDTGGTPIEIDGTGFANQATAVTFADIETPFSFGTQFNLSISSDTKLLTKTVGQNPAIVDTQVCTVTDCSSPSSAVDDTSDVFLLFPPGNPKIDSITPDSGPATGGTEVTITGENLGCVTDVSFGGADADDATNAEALLDCGSTNTVTVTAPPGKVGTVPVTLATVESSASAGVSPATGSFTYTQPPKQTVTVHRSGNGTGKITSSPAGISCTKKTCSHAFTYGTTVALKARAAKGSTFAGWSGGCVHTKPCKLSAKEPLSVTAKFTLRNCVVPKVTGKTLAEAKHALEAHFCTAGKITQVFSTKAKAGRVAAQKPKPGTHLKHNGKVALTVSKGP